MSYATPHMSHSTPTSSATPTRHTSSSDGSSNQVVNYNEYMSPSAYLNDNAFTPSAESNTPYTHHASQDTGYLPHDSSANQWGSASTSNTSTPSLHHPQPVATHSSHVNETFGITYEEYGPSSSPTVQDYPTPSGHAGLEEEATPIMTDNQAPVQSSSYPQPPVSASMSLEAPGMHALASQHGHVTPEMLMSPFQPIHHPEQYAYMQQIQHQQQQQQYHHQHQQTQPAYVNPQDFQHAPAPPPQYQFHQQMGNPSYSYNGSPLESTTPAFVHQPQMPMGMPPAFMPSPANGSFAYMGQQQPGFAWPNPYGPARSRGQSPASSVSSSAVSLVRSASTCSDLHQKARPKTKLQFKDKADIVRIHKKDSSLRQEDIAKMYGVDRSTISKILLSSARWENPQELVAPVPKAPKTVGGRYPAIEELMHPWMDRQIAMGGDTRDAVVQKEAKRCAQQIGYPPERFKASAKWVDKFRERRIALGKPAHSAAHGGGFQPMSAPHYVYASSSSAPMTGIGIGLRPDSASTLSSSDSSGAQDMMYQQSPNLATPARMTQQHMSMADPLGLTRSESDLTQMSITPTRARSQSSPQNLSHPASVTPSSGKAVKSVRPSPLTLHRQDSYHGSSPSPRRPAGLTRANSIAGSSGGGSLRRGRPGSLGASVFGFSQITATPSTGHSGSALHSPATSISSSVGGHMRARSDVSTMSATMPYTTNMGGLVLSPDLSESGEMTGTSSQGVVPLTPATPADGVGSAHMVQAPDFGEQSHQGGQQYATMPNKHYRSAQMYGHAQPPTHYNQQYSNQQYSQPPSAYTSPLNPSHPVWQ